MLKLMTLKILCSETDLRNFGWRRVSLGAVVDELGGELEAGVEGELEVFSTTVASPEDEDEAEAASGLASFCAKTAKQLLSNSSMVNSEVS